VHGENADLALLHRRGDRRRQANQWPRRDVFEHEGRVRRADIFDLVHEAGRNLLALAIGDDGHAFRWLHGQTDANRVARAWAEFAIKSC
jgi:hypothetical protein